MEDQKSPGENHDTNEQANDDCDHDAGAPGDDHGYPSEGLVDGGYVQESFDDCGYVPEEWELAGPAASISLGDAADLDPALLAAMTGPGGLGGNALCRAYEQDGRPTCCARARSWRR